VEITPTPHYCHPTKGIIHGNLYINGSRLGTLIGFAGVPDGTDGDVIREVALKELTFLKQRLRRPAWKDL